MRAVTFSKTGGPEVLEVLEVADRTAGAGEVLVQVHAASINPIDVAA
jgi:NADPH2:quinone reductase